MTDETLWRLVIQKNSAFRRGRTLNSNHVEAWAVTKCLNPPRCLQIAWAIMWRLTRLHAPPFRGMAIKEYKPARISPSGVDEKKLSKSVL